MRHHPVKDDCSKFCADENGKPKPAQVDQREHEASQHERAGNAAYPPLDFPATLACLA